MTDDSILAAIPHRRPFLFVDEIIACNDNSITSSYTFKGDEFFFSGHYPDSPIVPGVILCESALQTGAVFISKLLNEDNKQEEIGDKIPVVTRLSEVKFKNIVLPGDTILAEVSFKERLANAWFFVAKISCNQKIVVRFEFSCTITERAVTIPNRGN